MNLYVLKHFMTFMMLWKLQYASEMELTQDQVKEYCQGVSFQPQCSNNEVIWMISARYGRMRIGRCVTQEEYNLSKEQTNPSRFFGCSTDVLSILRQKCSGKFKCDVPVINITATPCFPGLNLHLEVRYDCISVLEEERSCNWRVPSPPSHIIVSNDSKRICGTEVKPWILEAPNGQNLNISLLDLSAPHLVQALTYSELPCQGYGVVVDKKAKRNTSICNSETQSQLKLNFVSVGNVVEIFLSQTNGKNFILKVAATGCSNMIPPEDAWLKRNDDKIVIGCYSSDQTWHLRCEGEKWIGDFGNCSQAHESWIDFELPTKSSTDKQALIVVGIGSVTVIICIAIICTGIVCMRRFSTHGTKRPNYNTQPYFATSARMLQELQRLPSNMASDVAGNNAQTMSEVLQTPVYNVNPREFKFNTFGKSVIGQSSG